MLGIEPPTEVFGVDPERVFGLVIRAERLAMLRRVRLTRLGMSAPENYADPEHVRQDLLWAQEVFRRGRAWTIVDVTAKSIEESANEIVELLNKRTRQRGEPA